MNPLTDDATDAQRAAITHLTGPLLVLAGPGSGKTRVVTRRIAWLLEQGVPPDAILAITFTNKAAQEMRERVGELVDVRGLWVSTFHSMGARILRRAADRIGLDHSFTIYDDSDQVRVIRDVMRSMDMDTTKFRPNAVLSHLSRLKTELVTPEKARSQARDFFSQAVARVYPRYEERLRESNGVDFDDLLVKTLLVLQTAPEVREHYQRRFDFVLVDEYQDTNHVQFLLLKLLAEPQQNLHVTGDPDQSIYRFRGADIRNILDFEKQYADAMVVRLEENFRSTPPILLAADSLIRRNRDRKAKRLFTRAEGGEPIRRIEAEDEEVEARRVAEVALEAYSRGIPWSEMAVFYRVHALSRSLEQAFIERGIPYVIVRGTEFFRRAEVQDLLAYLKVLNNPRDNETLLRILNVPPRGIGDRTREQLLALAEERGQPLLATIASLRPGLGIPARSVKGIQGLADLFSELDRRKVDGIPGLIERLLRRTEYGAFLKQKYPDNHEDRWENVEQLVSSTAQYEERNPDVGLGGYLEEVSLLTDVDRYDPNSARVSFMTLHTAKGLEFRIVLLVGLEEGLLPHSRSVESPADLEEERRLLFVGITRAKEELYLLNARERRKWGSWDFSRASSFLAEIDSAAIAPDRPPEVREEDPHYEVDEYAQSAPGEEVRIGMRVRHSRFGVGRVLDLSGTGASARVTVDFEREGRKRLLLMYARLTSADEEPW